MRRDFIKNPLNKKKFLNSKMAKEKDWCINHQRGPFQHAEFVLLTQEKRRGLERERRWVVRSP